MMKRVLILVLTLAVLCGFTQPAHAQSVVQARVVEGVSAAGSILGPKIYFVSGSPEGATTAVIGSIAISTNGSTYQKATGSGNTGWVVLGASSTTGTFTTGLLVGGNSPSLTSPTKIAGIAHDFTGALGSGDRRGLDISMGYTSSGSWTGTGVAAFVNGTVAGTQTATANYGVFGQVASSTTATVSQEIAQTGSVVRGGGTTSFAAGFRTAIQAANGGTLSEISGVEISTPTEAGTGAINAVNGLRILDQTVSGVSRDADRALVFTFPNSGWDYVRAEGTRTKFVELTQPMISGEPYMDRIILKNRALTNAGLSNFNDIFARFVDIAMTDNTTKSITGMTTGVSTYGAFDFGTVQGFSGYFYTNATEDVTKATAINADMGTYGAGTVTTMMNFSASGGNNTGAVTNWFRYQVDPSYDDTAPVGTHVGWETEDISAMGNVTDNWISRYHVSSAIGGLTATGEQVDLPGTQSIADNGNGGTAATLTFTPTTTLVKMTCSDANGCDITMAETGIKDGQILKIVNVSANTINFADTANVTELAGAAALGQWDSLTMIYITDRWVEISRSNN